MLRVGPPPRERWRPGIWVRYTLWAIGTLIVSFAIAYIVAVRVLFPPQEVLAAGIVVPSVAGAPVADARRDLEAVGLRLGDVLSLPHPDRAPGIIIAQAPLPGQQLRAGAHVDVGISAGRAQTQVPDVVGLPEQTASRLLADLGFGVDLQRREARALPGSVIATEPPPGAAVFLPVRVLMLVSAGPARPDSVAAGGDSTAIQQ